MSKKQIVYGECSKHPGRSMINCPLCRMDDVDDEWKGLLTDGKKLYAVSNKKPKYKVGDYVKLPKGTYVWCVSLQGKIAFDTDEVFEITHTCVPNIDCYFAKRMMVLFEHAGIPGITVKAPLCEISLSDKMVTPYKLPEPNILDFKFKDE